MGDDPFGSLGLVEMQLTDKALFDAAFSSCTTRLSDYSFANTYIWREPIHLRWRMLRDCLCVFANGDGGLTLLFPPVGPGDISAATREALAICDAYNHRAGLPDNTRIEYVSAELLERLGGPFDAVPMSGDYVYDTGRMIDLAGGDLASKRQAKNRFARRYQARTEALGPHHVGPCLELLSRWQEQSGNLPCKVLHAVEFKRCKEIAATGEALACARALGLAGMVLWADERLIGFTLGEMLTADTCSIVVEKCDREYTGSAQYIFSEFCRQYWTGSRWCNVGDDWELPSLAWTKQSYRPSARIDKWVVRPVRPVKVGYVPMDRVAGVSPARLAGILPALGGEVGLTSFIGLASGAHNAGETPASRCAGDRANLHDLDDLLALERRCFTKPVALSRRQMRYLLQSPTARVHVIREDGRVVAAGLVLRRKTRAGRQSGRLYSMAVHDGCRGRGLGRVLLESCLDSLRRDGVESVVLEVDVANAPAIRLYERAGFRRVRQIDDYYGPGRHGWKMKFAFEKKSANVVALELSKG